MINKQPPVFYDHSGKRWKRIIKFASLLTLVVSIIGAAFSFSMIALPLTPLPLASQILVHRFIPKIETHEEAARKFIARKSKQNLKKEIAKENAPKFKAHPRSAGAPYSTTIGFCFGDDPSALASLQQQIDSLTYIAPQWLALNADGKSFTLQYNSKSVDGQVAKLARKHNVPLLMVLHNFDGQTFDWSRFRKLLINPDAQQSLAEDLRDAFLDYKKHDLNIAGINIDLEFTEPKNMTDSQRAEAARLLHDAFPRFIRTMKSVFTPRLRRAGRCQRLCYRDVIRSALDERSNAWANRSTGLDRTTCRGIVL